MKQSVSASLTIVCHENIKYAASANFIRTLQELYAKKRTFKHTITAQEFKQNELYQAH